MRPPGRESQAARPRDGPPKQPKTRGTRLSPMAIWLIIIGGLLSVVYGGVTVGQLMRADAGSVRMQEIAGAIAEGAQAYLKRQYTTIAGVGVVIFIGLGLLLSWPVAIGFLIGAILSGAAGFIGMNVSVRANVGANVGDCAGMAADLFETYAVTVVATMVLASIFFRGQPVLANMMLYPLAICAVCIVTSIIGTYFVKLGANNSIMGALYKGL